MTQQPWEECPPTDHRVEFRNRSKIISFRIDDAWFHRLEEIMERSDHSYENIGDFLRHLIRQQAFRKR